MLGQLLLIIIIIIILVFIFVRRNQVTTQFPTVTKSTIVLENPNQQTIGSDQQLINSDQQTNIVEPLIVFSNEYPFDVYNSDEDFYYQLYDPLLYDAYPSNWYPWIGTGSSGSISSYNYPVWRNNNRYGGGWGYSNRYHGPSSYSGNRGYHSGSYGRGNYGRSGHGSVGHSSSGHGGRR